MRLFLLVCLIAALPARAQEASSPPAPAPPAPVQEAPTQDPVPPLPESAPPLVQAPTPEQTFPPLIESPPLSLRRGESVRVETKGGQRHSGALVSLAPEALSLQADAEQVLNLLLADVQRLETRKRAVLPGVLTGGAVGAVGLGAFMGLICSIFNSEDTLACIGGGALLGGAGGAGVGAVIGLAVPRWSAIYEQEKQGRLVLHLTEPDDDVLAHWFSGSGLIGEVGLQLGYARDMRLAVPSDGWGGRLHLLVLLGPYIGLGPEVAWYYGVGTRTTLFNGNEILLRHSLAQLGGLLRLGTAIGVVRAALLGGLALSESRSTHMGASLGGEVEVLLGRLPVALEVRYLFNLDRQPNRDDPDYLTIGAGTRLRW